MRIVPEAARLEGFRHLGLTDPLIAQATGEQMHPYLWYRCLGPSRLVDQRWTGSAGPLVYPLWDCADVVTAVWQPEGRLQFIELKGESPEKYSVLAESEQGLWARIFDQLHEDYLTLERADFVVPARIIGFRFLDELWTEYESTSHETCEQHEKFMNTAVARIDARALTDQAT